MHLRQRRELLLVPLDGAQERDALDYFIMFEAVGAFITSGVFAFMIWLSNRRREKAFKGDENAALKIVLPCWQPMYIFLMVFYLLMSLALGLTFIRPLTVVSQFLVLQFTSLVMLALFSITPVLLTQKSVSHVAFRRTALIITPWFGICVLIWGISDLRSATEPLQICFWIISCIPSLILSLGILFKLISSRIQMGSTSNRASVEYLFVYTCFFVGVNIACVDLLAANNTHGIWKLSSLLATFSIVWNQLFPLALHRTLLADTKFWRGLGRHNRVGLAYSGTGATVHKPTMDLGLVGDGLQKVMADIEDLTIDFAFLKLVALIGEGSSAKVYKGNHKQQAVAIKVFTPPEVTEDMIDDFVTEAKLLSSLQHENIVSFFGICIRPPQIAMVMELCSGGNLKTSLISHSEKWRKDWRLRACYDAARAVEHLHLMGYIHRDLKAENFFIGENRVVKLGDFGEATKQLHHRAAGARASMTGTGGTGAEKRMSIVGTVAYMAPELVAASKKYSETIDIYSLAITFWEIWTGDEPFEDMNTFQIYNAVAAGRRPAIPEDTPQSFKDLLEAAWTHNPQERQTAAMIAPQLATILKDVYQYMVPAPSSIDRGRSPSGAASLTPPSGKRLRELSRKFLSPLRASRDESSSVFTSASASASASAAASAAGTGAGAGSASDVDVGLSPSSRLSRMIFGSPAAAAAGNLIASSTSTGASTSPSSSSSRLSAMDGTAPYGSEAGAGAGSGSGSGAGAGVGTGGGGGDGRNSNGVSEGDTSREQSSATGSDLAGGDYIPPLGSSTSKMGGETDCDDCSEITVNPMLASNLPLVPRE